MKVYQDGKTIALEKTKYMATIYDGHSHIERRVFMNYAGAYYVRINGWFAKVLDLKAINHFDVDVWYEG